MVGHYNDGAIHPLSKEVRIARISHMITSASVVYLFTSTAGGIRQVRLCPT